MKIWKSTKEAAELMNTTERTIQRRAKSGMLESRDGLSSKGRKRLEVLVEVDDQPQQPKADSLEPKAEGNHPAVSCSLPACELPAVGSRHPSTEGNQEQQPIADSLKPIVENQGDAGRDACVRSSSEGGQDASTQLMHSKDKQAVCPTESEDFVGRDAIPRTPVGRNGDRFEIATPAEKDEEKAFKECSQSEREQAWAKLQIVKLWNDFRSAKKVEGMSKTESSKFWDSRSSILAGKQLQVLGIQEIKSKTIYKWSKELKESGHINYPVALIPNRHSSGRKSKVPDEVLFRIRQLAADPRELRASHIYKILLSEHPDSFSFPCSRRTVTRFVAQARADRVLVSLGKGKKAYKNNVRVHIKRVNDNIPGKHYVGDGRPHDFMVYSPWRHHASENLRLLVRPYATMWVDAATGLIVGYTASYSESTHTVLNSLSRAIKAWGVPERITVDNGKSYQNYYNDPYYFLNNRKENSSPWKKAKGFIDQGQVGAYRKVGIEKITYSIPGNPESKQIEAIWNYVFEDFERSQAIYLGKSPEKRMEALNMPTIKLIEKYGDMIPNWDEFIQQINARIQEWNSSKRAVLKSADGNMMSPLEVMEYFKDEIQIPNPGFIDEWLSVPVEAKVQRDGIYCAGNWYQHRQSKVHLNKKCLVLFDEMAPETAQIMTENGQLWEGLAELYVPGSYVEEEQIQKAISTARSLEKQGLAVYAGVRSRIPGKLDQKEVNKIAKNTVLEIEGDAHKRRERIKDTGKERLSIPKRSKSPEGSGVEPTPDWKELLKEIEVPETEVQPEEPKNTEEDAILATIEGKSNYRGL